MPGFLPVAIPGSFVLYRWLGLEFEGSSGVSVNMLFHAFFLLVHGPLLLFGAEP